MSSEPTPKRRGVQDPQERRPRSPRLRGGERERVRDDVAKKYDTGLSIRAVAAEHGLSFGLTHTLLHEAKVTLRSGRRRKGDQ
ncbi:helix-turn-helix domain-containing protein [Streptomyces niveus]|uniref:helix-turn-helix domain-containing protein n=1 Tax=Streptomyces niveus TaxID=193462 RepID=UPI0036D21010